MLKTGKYSLFRYGFDITAAIEDAPGVFPADMAQECTRYLDGRESLPICEFTVSKVVPWPSLLARITNHVHDVLRYPRKSENAEFDLSVTIHTVYGSIVASEMQLGAGCGRCLRDCWSACASCFSFFFHSNPYDRILA